MEIKGTNLCGSDSKLLGKLSLNLQGYRGAADYSIQVQAKGNLRLVCEGVSHTAHVYWDDDRIVEHYNAYTPFEVVIRDVDNGEHTLRINADNRFSKDKCAAYSQ